MELVKKLKDSLMQNVTDTLTAYKRVVLIYTIAFVLGVLLIITAVVFAVIGKTILALAFGAIGLIDMVLYFVKLPADKIQASRSNLSQLQVVLIVWINDLINNGSMASLLLNNQNATIADYKTLSDISIKNADTLLRMIEEMAEPGKPKTETKEELVP